MMKNLLKLEGIQKLSKEHQKQINGSWNHLFVYCGPPRMCCSAFIGGEEFCDFGYCQPNGTCIWA